MKGESKKRRVPPKRSRVVSYRLTEAEYLKLDQVAQKAGLTPNELARSLARRAKGRITIKTTKQYDPAYIAQVKRIGNNLNQLAHNSHIFNRVSPNLEQLCEELREIIIHAAEEQLR